MNNWTLNQGGLENPGCSVRIQRGIAVSSGTEQEGFCGKVASEPAFQGWTGCVCTDTGRDTVAGRGSASEHPEHRESAGRAPEGPDDLQLVGQGSDERHASEQVGDCLSWEQRCSGLIL